MADAYVGRNAINCRVRFPHSRLQKTLVAWKRKVLQPYSLPIRESDYWDVRTEKTYYRSSFDTKTLHCFNQFRDLFYPKKEKCVFYNIIDFFHDPMALLVWYLDDGALRVDCKAFCLHTNSYRLQQVVVLQEMWHKTSAFPARSTGRKTLKSLTQRSAPLRRPQRRHHPVAW